MRVTNFKAMHASVQSFAGEAEPGIPVSRVAGLICRSPLPEAL
jgi:hypothetical protein